MSDIAHRFAEAAERMEGARYRLHGRDPAHGLDCVGLVAAALTEAGCAVVVPLGYSLRSRSVDGYLHLAACNGFAPCTGPVRRGDLLMARPGPAQHHLMVALDPQQIVHAHAGLRRVVIQPRPAQWPVCAHWRFII